MAVPVAVGGDGAVECVSELEERLFARLDLDMGTVDAIFKRDDTVNSSNWLTEQPGFRPYTKGVSAAK